MKRFLRGPALPIMLLGIVLCMVLFLANSEASFRDKPVLLLMDFRDFTGDPSLKGLSVAIPNEVARMVGEKGNFQFRRSCELPPDLIPQIPSTKISVPGIPIQIDTNKVMQWFKGGKLEAVVTGDFSLIGDRLTINIRYLDPKTQVAKKQEVIVHGEKKDAFCMAFKTAREIVRTWQLSDQLALIADDDGQCEGKKGAGMAANNNPKTSATLSEMDGEKLMAALQATGFPNPDILIHLEMDQESYKIGQKARIRFKSEQNGYLTLINFGTSGKVHLIFPNAHQLDNFVRGGEVRMIPGIDQEDYISVTGPAGTERLVALFTVEPSSLIIPDASAMYTTAGTRDLTLLPKKISKCNWNKAEISFSTE